MPPATLASRTQRLHLAARRPHQDFVALLGLAQLLSATADRAPGATPCSSRARRCAPMTARSARHRSPGATPSNRYFCRAAIAASAASRAAVSRPAVWSARDDARDAPSRFLRGQIEPSSFVFPTPFLDNPIHGASSPFKNTFVSFARAFDLDQNYYSLALWPLRHITRILCQLGRLPGSPTAAAGRLAPIKRDDGPPLASAKRGSPAVVGGWTTKAKHKRAPRRALFSDASPHREPPSRSRTTGPLRPGSMTLTHPGRWAMRKRLASGMPSTSQRMTRLTPAWPATATTPVPLSANRLRHQGVTRAARSAKLSPPGGRKLAMSAPRRAYSSGLALRDLAAASALPKRPCRSRAAPAAHGSGSRDPPRAVPRSRRERARSLQ